MQDETQVASATSSPDPLTADGPRDRDIEVGLPPPSSADNSGALIQNGPNVVQVFPILVGRFDFALAAMPGLQKKAVGARHAMSRRKGLV